MTSITRTPTFDKNQARLRAWGYTTDTSAGYGPKMEAALSVALDELEKHKPLPTLKPIIPENARFPMPVILEAIKGNSKYRVPASLTLAQWAIESNYGKAVTGTWNYGGITAKVKDAVFPTKPGTPLEPATLCWTHEVVNGKRIKCQRWFKNFDSPSDFFDAHSKLLGTSLIYAEARSKLPDVLAFADAIDVDYKPKAKDKNWRAYATDPGYAELIRSIIKSNNLTRYDVF